MEILLSPPPWPPFSLTAPCCKDVVLNVVLWQCCAVLFFLIHSFYSRDKPGLFDKKGGENKMQIFIKQNIWCLRLPFLSITNTALSS
jgi:hypothetical protein